MPAIILMKPAIFICSMRTRILKATASRTPKLRESLIRMHSTDGTT